MKKLLIATVVLLLATTATQAQLLKKLKDKVNNAAAAASGNSVSSTKDVAPILAEYVLVRYEGNAADNESNTASAIINAGGMGSRFFFEKSGNWYQIGGFGNVLCNGTYTLSGRDITMTVEENKEQKVDKGTYTAKMNYNDDAKKMIIEFGKKNGDAKIQCEVVKRTPAELANFEQSKDALFTYNYKHIPNKFYTVSKNSVTMSFYGGDKVYYDFKENGKLTILNVFMSNVSNPDCEFTTIDLSNIKFAEIKAIRESGFSFVLLPLTTEADVVNDGRAALKTYKTTKAYKALISGEAESYKLLKECLLKNATDAQKASFNKVVAKYDADVKIIAATLVKEEKERDEAYERQKQIESSNASSSSSLSSSSSQGSSKSDVSITLKNKSNSEANITIVSPGGGSKDNFSIPKGSSKRKNIKVGSKVLVNGSEVFTASANMDGADKVIMQ